MKKYHITSLIKEILAENKHLQDLINQRNEVNAKLDKIVQDGGKIILSDPLYIKSRFLTKQINKLKGLKEQEKGTLKVKKGTSDRDIKKYTDQDIDVEMVDEEVNKNDNSEVQKWVDDGGYYAKTKEGWGNIVGWIRGHRTTLIVDLLDGGTTYVDLDDVSKIEKGEKPYMRY